MRYFLPSIRSATHLAGLLLGASLAACQSNPDTATTAATRPATEAAVTATAAADSPGTWYRQYCGVLPGSTDTITLHLQVWPRAANDTESGGVAASYAGPDGHPFSLSGKAGPVDSLTLLDYAPEHGGSSQPIAWRLQLQGNLLTGSVGGRPVQFRQAQPAGSIRLVSRFFQDSVAAFPQTSGTPYAQQRLLALLPSAASYSTLQDNLLRGLRADTVDTTPIPALPKLWQQRRHQYTQDYRQDAAGSRPEPSDTSSPTFGIGLRYDEQQLMHVLWNQAPLLSIGYFSYSYTGGAHGTYGTSAATFDTRTGRRLRYDDIFRAGTQPQLGVLLDQAARRMLGLAPGASLEGPLFVEHLPATHNVFLTSGGAVFIYSPYEVASYSQGEIRVFVPLSELRPLLRPGLPVAGGGEVSRP